MAKAENLTISIAAEGSKQPPAWGASQIPTHHQHHPVTGSPEGGKEGKAKAWGLVGGRIDIIVIFKQKPKTKTKTKPSSNDNKNEERLFEKTGFNLFLVFVLGGCVSLCRCAAAALGSVWTQSGLFGVLRCFYSGVSTLLTERPYD